MLLHPWFFILVRILILLSILSTIYLYLYPAFHGCSFPRPSLSQTKQQHGEIDTAERARKAPFRLLAFGDPQLEGDTSLPPEHDFKFPGFDSITSDVRDREFQSAIDSLRIGFEDWAGYVLYVLKYTRKQLDLWGNDFYLAHIYRALNWWTKPSHVTVLGDLLGSQWISDEEFESRSARYWGRVFKGAQKVPEELLSTDKTENYSPRVEVLGADPDWSRRIINIAGNHDIGYAGDLDEERVERFEREFGPVNGDIVFQLPSSDSDELSHSGYPPAIRVVILNSMNLDTPARSQSLQTDTYTFLNDVIISSEPVESHNTTTILLTHIPLYKESGVCIDDPFFSFYTGHPSHGVKEQNLISNDLSKDAILQGLYGKSPSEAAAARGMGRDGIILTGHDHEGCDVYHYANRSNGQWQAQKWVEIKNSTLLDDTDLPGLREVTLRSMMGEFGGNAALVSAWWIKDQGRWSIAVRECGFGIQHVWWAVHILDLITVLVSATAGLAYMFGGNSKNASVKESRKLQTGKESGKLQTSKESRKPQTGKEESKDGRNPKSIGDKGKIAGKATKQS